MGKSDEELMVAVAAPEVENARPAGTKGRFSRAASRSIM